MRALEATRATLRDPIAAGGLIVNALPVVGVLVWGWGLAGVVILYWLENVIIGVANLAKMAASGGARGVGGVIAALFLGAFFTFHYGVFCLVHGLFVLAMFAGVEPAMDAVNPVVGLTQSGGPVGLALQAAPYMAFAAGVVATWKAVEFAVVFIGRGEMRRTGPHALMMAPYGRIVALHLTVMAAGFALISFGSPLWGVLAMVAGKTLFDFALEAQKRLKTQPAAPPAE